MEGLIERCPERELKMVQGKVLDSETHKKMQLEEKKMI